MGPDYYKVVVLHYINPHLIWVFVDKDSEEKNMVFEQIGIYGILPQNMTFGIDCVVKTEPCGQWMQAAVVVMKNVLIEAAEVWFSPTYIDKKASIFDDNTHRYGDLIIILKSGEEVNLLDEIVKSHFAIADECLFHQELRDGNLNTKLNYVTTLDIINKLKKSHKTEDIPTKVWENALMRQTTVLQEAKHLETKITSRKLEVRNRDMVDTLLKNKLNDLKLCKDIDDNSAGRASGRSKPSSLLSVAIRKKLDMLKTQQNKTQDDNKNVSNSDPNTNGVICEDKLNNTQEFHYKEENDFNEDCYNVKIETCKRPRSSKNVHNKDTKLVAFGPAGLNAGSFSVKSEPFEEKRCVAEESIIPTAAKNNDGKENECVLEENQDQGTYSNTDSEVNINISKIKLKSFMLENFVANKCKTVDAKVETLSAMKRKIRYIEERISKINDSLSSTSDKDSIKCEIDSDNESFTTLQEKLGLGKSSIKIDVSSEPHPETFVKELKTYVNPFKNLDGSVSIFVDKLVSPILMVHTKKNNRIQPVSNMRDIPFGTDIHKVLKNMSIQRPMRPQTVSWPTILRGHSFFLIGPYNSGNTMGYLPAVCRLVSDLKNTYNHGLTCIIICATSHSVAAVESACKMFLDTAKIFACYAGMSDINITTTLLNGCDLLICTPSMLVRLIQEDFCLDLRNLSTFVIDDCEHISKVYLKELKFCLLKVRDVVKNRANKELKVQYIVVSRIWCDFMLPLARIAPDTVICISAFEECVLYSRASTSVELVMQENKLDTVIKFLKGIDRAKKTVIVCRHDNEVQVLEKALSKLKYVVFACDSTMTLHDLYNLDKTLKDYEEPVSGPVLVCCDGNLSHLNVTDAQYLVHYSLPGLFSMFCKRFAVLIDNYPSIFETEESNISIKILLDDNNIEQLPKILHFVKRCTNNVPTVLDEISTSVLSEKDLKKAQNLVPLCTKLLTLGVCPDFWNCVERHAIFKDFDNPKSWLPKEGIITFQMLHYHSAVSYSARLTSSTIKSNTIKYAQTYSLLSFKMGMYYSKEINRRLHGAPKVGDLCAVTLKQNLFVRCQVMKILRSTTNNKSNLILIKLVDEEKYEMARDTWLYYLPDELKSIETHVVKVLLANLMPQDKDVTFSMLAQNHLRKITEENEDLYMRGEIALVIGNCIFVDTLEACQDLSSLEEIVVKHDFRKELLDRHAAPNPDHIVQLRKLFSYTDCNPKEETQNNNVPKAIKILPKVRWAHLESDGFSSVFFMFAENPSSFFVRPIKFDKCLTTLIKDIKKHVSERPEPIENIQVGDIILAEFPDDSTYERARVDGVPEKNKVKCFFVDQAEWRDVSIEKILSIPDKFITVLPFQAIECRLVGIQPVCENWTDFTTNFLVDNCYDSGDKLKQLYAKYFTKEKAEFTEGHKYGIILIDTYSDEDVIINQMMIDKNLAEENNEVGFLSDTQFKRKSEEPDTESDDDEPKNNSTVVDNKNIQQFRSNLSSNLIRSMPLVDSDDSFDNFDFVTDNSGKLGSVPIAEVVAIKELSETESQESVVPSPVEETVTKLSINNMESLRENIVYKTDFRKSDQVSKPKLLWRQNNNTVTINIKLIVEDYDMIIKDRYIKFSTDANDTKYEFDFELYGVVDLNKSSHSNKGQYIQVKLCKVMARNWLTLTRDSSVTKWIVYDIDSIDVSSDEETDIDSMVNTKNFINNFSESDSDDNLQDDVCFSYKRE